ncbi:MAG TPA: tRNA1(Val) (adenine(37)-N6)-methyltransferase [Syntrophaceae bacterium]|nr:tRNA1(Val) (adenine(37)-N6)-methyltransferase [Syntrophaceae bacterium]
MEGTFLKGDETLDTIFNGRLKIIQKRHGYRFSIDAILLPGFFTPQEGETGVDLGTGSGIIPLILASKTRVKRIFGIEIQEDLVEMARRNVTLNHLEDKISIIHGDMKNLEGIFDPESIDWVTSNPPYYRMGSGRINPHLQKAIARHEIKGSLEDVINASRYLLKPMGKMALIYCVERLVDLFYWLRTYNLEPKRLRLVYSDSLSQARFLLVEAIKGSGTELKIERPLYVYKPEGGYSEEIQHFYA